MARVTIQPGDRLLDKYYKTLRDLRERQHARTEGETRRAFSALLSGLGRRRKLDLVEEAQKKASNSRKKIRLDGVLRDEWMRDYAYWEAKDSGDQLDSEIIKKKSDGYPLTNIIFEDTVNAVLYQDGYEVRRTLIREKKNFAALLSQYLNYRAEAYENFNEAVQSYGDQIREIATQLKDKIDAAHRDNSDFQRQFDEFMQLCRTSLNPNISIDAVDEMLIQHLMTERIITRVFNMDQFAQTNVIAANISKVISALTSRHFNLSEFLGSLHHFHQAIEEAADPLDFSDKQSFINTVYERFFQGYSVKVADTHGIVYTPQEIVDFMCAAVEEVLENEFGKKLGDEGVTVIDPCTGTGNFVVNILRRAHQRNLRQFEDFYKKRLFANEVMLMPYYIASLNIEHEYFELTGKREAFEGLCFVDTLDLARGRQMTFLTEANTERVERQKAADINVIIGNPPYNVGQLNENDNNKNRKYDVIDKRIRATYAKDSKATNKNALSDAYVKFFRWATDRLDGRDGIVCYVSNNGFVDGFAFDGMRKHLAQDFDSLYIVDLKGNVRKDSMRDGIPIGEKNTVFGLSAMVGVSMAVLVRNKQRQDKRLYYSEVDWKSTRQEKFEFLEAAQSLRGLEPRRLVPNSKHTWLRSDTEDEFDAYFPIGSKEAKRAKPDQAETIFETYSGGVKTNRDMYVYDFSYDPLAKRTKQFVEDYNAQVDKYKRQTPKLNIDDFVDYDNIAWSRDLKLDLKRGNYARYIPNKIRASLYRPFTRKRLFLDRILNEEVYQQLSFFPDEKSEAENRLICVPGIGDRKGFGCVIADSVPSLDLAFEKAQCFPFYTYDEDGSDRRENISDWALDQFRDHYKDPAISKWDIFYYVYALLHHPGYRERYALDLKRNLPRIPFVPPSLNPSPHKEGRDLDARAGHSEIDSLQSQHQYEVPTSSHPGSPSLLVGEGAGGWGAKTAFHAFSRAGAALADLHLNYESADRYPLDWEATRKPANYRVEKMLPQGKTDSEQGNYKVFSSLKYNESLTLNGIPERAFAYRLGNRSALEWIVDQYRVKTDKRSGIKHDPNGYSDDEQYILQLIERVITVSLRTVDIVDELSRLPFREQ